jgi:hypothetical protein
VTDAGGIRLTGPVIGLAAVGFKPQTSSHFRGPAADHGRSSAAAAIVAIADELRDDSAVPGIKASALAGWPLASVEPAMAFSSPTSSSFRVRGRL